MTQITIAIMKLLSAGTTTEPSRKRLVLANQVVVMLVAHSGFSIYDPKLAPDIFVGYLRKLSKWDLTEIEAEIVMQTVVAGTLYTEDFKRIPQVMSPVDLEASYRGSIGLSADDLLEAIEVAEGDGKKK